jgi:hypothetical protein
MRLCLDSLAIAFVTLFLMAFCVYLPDHVASIYGHVHYYFTADVSMIKDYIPSASSILQGASDPATDAINVVAASAAPLAEL